MTDYALPTANNSNCWNDPISDQNVTEIIRSWNFTAEEYTVVTDDGYSLLLVRAYKEKTQSTPILIGHGIMLNSLGFVDRDSKSLTYFLGNLGYEVWLISFRGTRYSRTHRTLTVSNREYWQFSFHHMGLYDINNSSSFIYNKTGQKMIYIGFSMGTSASLAFSSNLKSEDQAYFIGHILLAPVAYLNEIKSIIRLGVPFWPLAKEYVYLSSHGEVLPRNDLSATVCNANMATLYICELFKSLIFGFDLEQIDPTTLPTTNILNPDSTGAEVVTHYVNIIESTKFKQYDYGPIKNLIIYGSSEPPVYDLSNVAVPQILISGENDAIATPNNVQQLCNELGSKSCCGLETVSDLKFNHNDFLVSKDIETLLFPSIVTAINNLQSEICLSPIVTDIPIDIPDVIGNIV